MNFAQATSFKWKKDKFELDVPSDWQSMVDFMGIPMTFLSKKRVNETRPTIQVIPTAASKIEFDKRAIAKFNQNYKKKREKWLKQRAGFLTYFNPMKKIKINDQEVVMVETKYKWSERYFHEKSYYLNCGNKVYHLKSLTTVSENSGMKENDQVIGSFKCVQ